MQSLSLCFSPRVNVKERERVSVPWRVWKREWWAVLASEKDGAFVRDSKREKERERQEERGSWRYAE